METSGFYKVSAFTVNNRGKYPHVGVLLENDGHKNVYFLKGYAKSVFVKAFENRQQLKEYGYLSLPCKNLDIVYLPSEDNFAEFNTNGLCTFNGNSFAKIENLKFYTPVWQNFAVEDSYNQDDINNLKKVTMEEIDAKIKVVQCRRLEELEEGTEHIIRGIREIEFRNKIRYVLSLENSSDLYVSNYWLEKEINDLHISLHYRIKLKLDKIRTTPSKIKNEL
uniref:Uncharacterized protein LOC114348913 n=1 Tax=Diabrotica virgifera virgifera TaxID=50390 RepID=A0A6P7H0S1_DIAVI